LVVPCAFQTGLGGTNQRKTSGGRDPWFAPVTPAEDLPAPPTGSISDKNPTNRSLVDEEKIHSKLCKLPMKRDKKGV